MVACGGVPPSVSEAVLSVWLGESTNTSACLSAHGHALIHSNITHLVQVQRINTAL